MKVMARAWTLFALTSVLLVGAESSNAATTSTSNDALLLLGPVESIDAKAGTAVVVGQKIVLRNLKQPTIGSTVAVFGKISADGSITASAITSAGLYVSGASPIVVTGKIRAIDQSLGRLIVGQLVIDLSPTLSSNPFPDLKIGDVAQIGGTQPNSLGLVLASQFVVSKSSGIIGGGLDISGIIGGGFSAEGIIGGGAALDGIIGGGKVAVDGIIGGGR